MCRILFEISSEFPDMKIFATGATCCHCTSCCNCCCCCCCCCSCCVSIFSDFSASPHALCHLHKYVCVTCFRSLLYLLAFYKYRYSFIQTRKLTQNYSTQRKTFVFNNYVSYALDDDYFDSYSTYIASYVSRANDMITDTQLLR